MAHHQGMSLLSLAYLLLDRPMQKRFESDPIVPGDHAACFRSGSQRPRLSILQTPELSDMRAASGGTEMPVRVFSSPDTPVPEVQLLSNGRYHVMVTNAGGGYSRWKDIAVTRWREDTYLRQLGHVLLPPRCGEREVLVNRVSADAQTGGHIRSDFLGRRGQSFAAATSTMIRIPRSLSRRKMTSNCAGSASPTRSRTRRTIDVTSYAEVVLASSAADALHPAFSNLFVQTEIIRQQRAILCTRRPRSLDEHAPWMFHLMTAHGAEIGEVSYETDRMKFIGRGKTVANPQAMSGQLDSLRGRSRAARAQCSIRLSQSGTGSRSIRKNRQR